MKVYSLRKCAIDRVYLKYSPEARAVYRKRAEAQRVIAANGNSSKIQDLAEKFATAKADVQRHEEEIEALKTENRELQERIKTLTTGANCFEEYIKNHSEKQRWKLPLTTKKTICDSNTSLLLGLFNRSIDPLQSLWL